MVDLAKEICAPNKKSGWKRNWLNMHARVICSTDYNVLHCYLNCFGDYCHIIAEIRSFLFSKNLLFAAIIPNEKN